MNLALRELQNRLSNPIRWVVWISAVTVCVVANPFNANQAIGLLWSIPYWGLVLGASIVWAEVSIAIVAILSLKLKRPLEALIEAFLFAAPYSVFLTVVNLIVHKNIPPESHLPLWLAFSLPFAIYFSVITIRYFWGRDPAETSHSIIDTNIFLKRLPARLGNSVLRVSSQDHYIEVHTELGSDLILMRFADALQELQGLNGLQVHRSHWVCLDAVICCEKKSGKMNLRLTNGTEVPVSRSFRDVVEAKKFS